VVTAVSAAQIAHALSWNEPMFDLAGATLGEVAGTFARRTGRRIEFADVALPAVQIGGRFPTDNVDGFFRAIEEIYDVKAEWRADGVIVLRKSQ
jgi:ferric-dicitrate binding protein FerR (iron transport regulator)